MNTVDISALRQALGKATPGPWEFVPEDHAEDWSDQGPWITSADKCVASGWGHDAWGMEIELADAKLIVLLRNNAEALLNAAATCGAWGVGITRPCDRRKAHRGRHSYSDEEGVQAEWDDQVQHERDTAVQALWDVYAALGFDTDGDKTPAARLGDGVEAFARRIVAAAAQHRRESEADYDRDLEDAYRRGAEAERARCCFNAKFSEIDLSDLYDDED